MSNDGEEKISSESFEDEFPNVDENASASFSTNTEDAVSYSRSRDTLNSINNDMKKFEFSTPDSDEEPDVIGNGEPPDDGKYQFCFPLRSHKPARPTQKLTTKALLYIIVFHGLGNALLCLIINVLINYILNLTSPNDYVHMWNFPVGTATNLLVTNFIQGTLECLIGGALSTRDILRLGKTPLGAVPPLDPSKANRSVRWLVEKFPRFFFGLCCYSFKDFGMAVLTALCFGVAHLIFIYLPTLGIVAIINATWVGDAWSMLSWYIFIGVYTAFIGFWVEMLVAYIAIVASGVAIKRIERTLSATNGELICSREFEARESDSDEKCEGKPLTC